MSFHSKGAFRPVASRRPLVSHPAQGPKRILLSFGDSQGFRIRSSKAALTSIQHMRGGRRVARSAVAMALLVIAVDHLPWERGGEGEEESNERTLKSRNVYAWPKEVNDVILSLSLSRSVPLRYICRYVCFVYTFTSSVDVAWLPLRRFTLRCCR